MKLAELAKFFETTTGKARFKTRALSDYQVFRKTNMEEPGSKPGPYQIFMFLVTTTWKLKVQNPGFIRFSSWFKTRALSDFQTFPKEQCGNARFKSRALSDFQVFSKVQLGKARFKARVEWNGVPSCPA